MHSIQGTPRRILVVLSLLLAGTALALYLLAPAPPVPGQTPLQDIQDLHALQSQFNDDKGYVRLVLLLSPT